MLTGLTDTELDDDTVPMRLVVEALALYGGSDDEPVPVRGAECVCVTAVEFSEQMVV